MAREPSFEAYAPTIEARWEAMKITRPEQVDRAAQRIMQFKERYKQVESLTGVPWDFLGVLHMRESNNNFAGVLHNGEKIIGTGRKTRLVPKGRGPFVSWVQAAVDATGIKGWNGRARTWWSTVRKLFEGERFNGWGYYWKGLPSAYVWAASNQYKGGKYVSDGVFSRSAYDVQLGIAPVMKRLEELNKPFQLPESRRWTFFSTLRGWLEKLAAGFTLSWSSIEQMQTWFPWQVFLVILIGAGTMWWVLRSGERQTVREYREGRYFPSGELNDGLDLEYDSVDGEGADPILGVKHSRAGSASDGRRRSAAPKGGRKVAGVKRGRRKAAKPRAKQPVRKGNRSVGRKSRAKAKRRS